MSEERTPLELAMLAAWLNVRPDQIPAENRAQACPHTMAAWKRVGEAALEYHREAIEAQGWAVVPKKPTPEMLEAGDMGLSNAGVDNSTTEDAAWCWAAMIAAALGETE